MTAFREGAEEFIGPVDVEALIDYFMSHSPVKAGTQNRIVRMD